MENREEARLRRMAKREGVILSKSRTRDPFALGFGMYCIRDASTGNPLTPGTHEGRSIYGSTLEEIRDWLTT